MLAHGNTHALVVVARFTVKKAQLDETSNIIGGGFGTGALLQTLRDKLGADFTAITLRSTATRLGKCTALDSDTGVCTTGEAVVFPARESDQLVEESANPCKSNNGGCDTLVRCKADPSMASGVMCGECPDGYTSSDYGVTCADADECAVNNGGCDPRVECINTVGGYKCGVCPDGFTKTKAGGCEDIDECARANGGCDKRTDCVNSAGGFSCGPCPAGYKGSGETKCVQESGCSVKNGGCDALTTCTDGGGGSTCGACPAGYEGDGETGCVDIDACAESPCYPGVHCKDLKPPAGADGFKCGKCPPGSTGDGIGAAGCAFNPCFIKNGGLRPAGQVHRRGQRRRRRVRRLPVGDSRGWGREMRQRRLVLDGPVLRRRARKGFVHRPAAAQGWVQVRQVPQGIHGRRHRGWRVRGGGPLRYEQSVRSPHDVLQQRRHLQRLSRRLQGQR